MLFAKAGIWQVRPKSKMQTSQWSLSRSRQSFQSWGVEKWHTNMIREIPTCFLLFVTGTQTWCILKWREVSWASPGSPRLTLSLKEPHHDTSQGILQPWSQEACFQPRTYLKKDKEVTWSFPGGSAGKETAHNARDLGSIPGLGRSPGEGNGKSLQYSCLENLMGREA